MSVHKRLTIGVALASMLLVVMPAQPAGALTPLHHWAADNSAVDGIGGANGIRKGDATFGPGSSGQAFSLDGNGDFVEMADAPTELFDGSFSVEATVKTTDASGTQAVVSKNEAARYPFADRPSSFGGTNFWSTPDNAALDITGDLDLRAAVAADDWDAFVPFAMKYNNVAGGRSFYFSTQSPNKVLYFNWSGDGTLGNTAISTAPLPVSDGALLLVRVTLDVVDGSGNNVVRFFTKTSTPPNAFTDLGLDTGWTQLGDPVVQSGATSVFAGPASLVAGAAYSDVPDAFLRGTMYGLVVKNGINGTTVANPDFGAQSTGNTNLTDASGRSWGHQQMATAPPIGKSGYLLAIVDGLPRGEVRDSDAGGPVQVISGPASVADGNFHNLRLVRDTVSGTLALFVDSLLAAYSPLDPVAADALRDDDGVDDVLNIGGFFFDDSTTPGGFFTGLIDEAKLYGTTASRVHLPTALSVVKAKVLSGGLAELKFDDGQTLCLKAKRRGTKRVIKFDTTFGGIPSTCTDLRIEYEGAQAPSTVKRKISVFDPTTGKFVVHDVGTGNAGVSLPCEPYRTAGQLKVRISAASKRSFSMQVDKLIATYDT